jgi:hypothetical protein
LKSSNASLKSKWGRGLWNYPERQFFTTHQESSKGMGLRHRWDKKWDKFGGGIEVGQNLFSKIKKVSISANPLKFLVGTRGFEPPTP